MISHWFKKREEPVATLTIEHGLIKLVVCRGREVLDYRLIPASPQFFRESLVSNQRRISPILQNAFQELGLQGGRVAGAVPGFQTGLRLLSLPRAAGFDPGVVIPQEANRIMGVSPETSLITWHRLPNRVDQTRWLVLSASRRSVTSLLDTARQAGAQVEALELRPFALARAVNERDAVIAWVATDGCDVLVVKGAAPLEYQSLFWGAESVEGDVLAERVTQMVERLIQGFDQNNPEGPLEEDVSLYICGSSIGREPTVAARVAENLQRPLGELAPPLQYPADLPVHDLVVNLGLALAEV